ncbi:MAG: ATP-grasp domain-containing protein [Anaerolineae bacterium]|nr:ATP-grasp domain-containing protein [Anaerolineae bacterium]
MDSSNSDNRIILLMGTHSYRGNAFVQAAERLGLDIVRALDMPKPLADYWQATLPLDYKLPDKAVKDLVAYVRQHPVRTILSVDDSATAIAARACEILGLSHNAPDATVAARDKAVMRERLKAGGVPSPHYQLFHTDDDPTAIAPRVAYPCVVKPTMLSASQGVIRANTPEEFVAAFNCTRAIILAAGGEPGMNRRGHILVEDYIDGFEVALEGILARGQLKPLALFDKPDPLVGPYFEETIYVTPSRLSQAIQAAILDCTVRACAALGLREGPVHAELRINEAGPWIVEVAARSIGGLCSKILRFGTEDIALEELIIRQAMGLDVGSLQREGRPGGVMMIPMPGAGVLKGVTGLDDARAVPGIEEIDITIAVNHPVVPLPEGSSYLGFIFARGERPDEVEAALREAHRRLHFTIVPHIRLLA